MEYEYQVKIRLRTLKVLMYCHNIIHILFKFLYCFCLQWERSVLHVASMGGHVDVINILLHADLDVNQTDKVCIVYIKLCRYTTYGMHII